MATGLTEDRYIKWIQVMPGESRVVHHVLPACCWLFPALVRLQAVNSPFTSQNPTAHREAIVATHAYINGNVITGNDDFDVVEAFAISDGRFVAVGSTEDVLKRVSASVEVVDLQGLTVLPGFNDNHIHMDRDLREWEDGTLEDPDHDQVWM